MYLTLVSMQLPSILEQDFDKTVVRFCTAIATSGREPVITYTKLLMDSHEILAWTHLLQTFQNVQEFLKVFETYSV